MKGDVRERENERWRLEATTIPRQVPGVHARNQASEATQLTLKVNTTLLFETRRKNYEDFLGVVSHSTVENSEP